MIDADARRRIREDLDTTLVVEAAAGTGKTSELVRRIAAVVRAGRGALDSILAVTFTDRAAGEMKLRLRAQLDEEGLLGRGSAFEAARIGTIHSLCADILRELPVEAGVDPAFAIADDSLFEEAFAGWFEEQVTSPGEGVRRALRRPPPRGRTVRGELRDAAWARVQHRDFDAPWARVPLDSAADLAAAAAGLAERFPSLVRLGGDPDAVEAELVTLRRRHKPGSDNFVLLDEALARADADFAAALHADLASLVGRYEVIKRRAGKLDFLDLLLRARDLLRAGALAGRFSHVFVDESQDIDPVQADILLLLGGQPFLVGDPKQSIYRFRRADVACYQALVVRLTANGAEVVRLTTSFRAVPAIQDAVNAAFAPRMSGGGHPGYVPLRPQRPARSHPGVLSLPLPGVLYPDGTAAFVQWLTERSGWGFAPRDVCVLLRRFQAWGRDLTGAYVRALEARGLPHLLVGGRSFHDREEIQALRTALRAIEWPDDELSVFAALRGPLFGFCDDELLAWRDGGGRLAAGGGPGAVGEALMVLAALHAQRNRRPAADTLARLLRATRAHAGFAHWKNGSDVLAAVRRLGEVARRFDGAGPSSFRAFVARLERAAAEGEADPIVEEGIEGVRIMTVHAAKGLEFPVVILADPEAPSAPLRPSRFVDGKLWAEPIMGSLPAELRAHPAEALRRDAEEELRVVYVAATRARDLLVVPAQAGWADLLAGQAERFDPSLLELAAPAAGGFDPYHRLQEGAATAAGVAAHAAWAAERAAVLARAGAEGLPARPAAVAGPGDVPVEQVAIDPERPRGRRFGALVHACLAAVPFDGAGLEALAAYHARLLGATPEEVVAAVAAVRGALAHPLLGRASAAGEVRREAPIHVLLDGTVVEGVIDLAFREGDAWTVVEVKTEEASAERHGAQAAAYAAALSTATGAPAQAVVLGV